MLYEEIKQSRAHTPEGVRKIYEAVIKDLRSLVINDLSIDSELIPNGSLLIDVNNYKMKIKKNNEFQSIEPTNVFEQEAIEGIFIKRNSVNGNRIQQFSITRDRIQQESLTAEEIENDTITGAKIKSETIENKHLSKDAVKTAQIKNESVTSEKIKPESISSNHIKESSVGGAHIKTGAVEEKHIETGAVTTDKIKDNSIQEKHIQEKSITNKLIGDAQISSKHLAESCVNVNHLNPNSVSTEKMQNASVTQQKIASNAVNGDKIQVDSINIEHLTDALAERILASLEVVGGVGTLPILRALENLISKNLSVSENTYLNALHTYGNATVDGKLHAKGDVTTDGRIYRVSFNDLAEAYVPGEKLEPGDIVAIEEDGKVYKSHDYNDMIVGVISDCYADCYGASIEEILSGKKVPVGLIGKVPVKIVGPIKLGQYVVASHNGVGYGTNGNNAKRYGIGRALESKTSEGVGKVLCLVFPN